MLVFGTADYANGNTLILMVLGIIVGLTNISMPILNNWIRSVGSFNSFNHSQILVMQTCTFFIGMSSR
jgi:hypothetical protein